ncbi:DUF2752 domain-containing protein [Lachnospiraceae bacterium MD1]|jgi:hypothetical protein|uniref:DUF2752 domain-containing protein n=1 Tax=Variimorphobacter saccharofermentans TaxID=2755051 RepID=A0A839K1H9_9FIRM|nr:DUF2752 domain-containing protein [Variimorphobacter saccharofermentans]MBB2183755.1 DUF2752 domain-containing protein [Variimorphobacter saccharofermentans]
MNKMKLLKIITILIPVLMAMLFAVHEYILNWFINLPRCPAVRWFDIYCPACGNTRSTIALLHGDMLTSLRYNIVPLILAVLLLASYIELVTYSFGRHIRLLPRKLGFYIILIILLMAYFIIRNFIPYLTP